MKGKRVIAGILLVGILATALAGCKNADVTKKERENTFRDLKRLVDRYQIKLDIPKLRQMECWQNYDLTTTSLDDYSIYLPTLTLSAGFPFTKTYFNDSSGYMLGVDYYWITNEFLY